MLKNLLGGDAPLGTAVPHSVQEVDASGTSSSTALFLRLNDSSHVSGSDIAHQVVIGSVPVVQMGRWILLILVGIQHAEKLPASSSRVLPSERIASAEKHEKGHTASPNVLSTWIVVCASNIGARSINVNIRCTIFWGSKLGNQNGSEPFLLISSTGESKISNLERKPLVKHDIVRLDISVRSGFVVNVFHTIHQLEKVVTCETHGKCTSALQEREQVSARAMLQNYVWDMLSSFAKATGSRALLIINSVNFHDVWMHKLGKSHETLQLLDPV
mmetsp:Transcript_48652/g.152739  ORF Transcript_48652/g.152739 Transcript_48652/m.152739 type:complete len:273 (-) Transcript_48652:345-1163(-)